MKCENCQLNKLSEEFPFGTISPTCEHVTSWCLKCLVNYLKESQNHHQCPICETELTEQEFNEYCLLWDNANFKIDFKSPSQIHTKVSEQNNMNSGNNPGIFYVDETDNTLTSYGICANSHIQLVVVLYSISKKDALKNLVFDLYWGYPASGVDFLDGSCLIYEGNKLWKTYDYKHKVYSDILYISHSGDDIDRNNATGHHKIQIKLDQLPPSVTQLYLILSSFKSLTIENFRNPSFKLYDEENPNKQLCEYNIHKAGKSRAVIMCLIDRSYYGGKWKVIEVGRLSEGNVMNYSPIMENIKDLIEI
ncbi:10178_t:CDS:2 [Cetraspora pellucida]|uniref:10178_t:CDS:1 n=1 Tax=Cetraspora pellucida TaxID=1433469 RepID=A0ACA9JWK3_9GLOM|nr:10178_t:CDS:2 [Cetraspora pellucida]